METAQCMSTRKKNMKIKNTVYCRSWSDLFKILCENMTFKTNQYTNCTSRYFKYLKPFQRPSLCDLYPQTSAAAVHISVCQVAAVLSGRGSLRQTQPANTSQVVTPARRREGSRSGDRQTTEGAWGRNDAITIQAHFSPLYIFTIALNVL